MITFRESDHTYWTGGGKQLPSVSAIIKDISTAQYGGVSEERMQAASVRGKKVHAIVEADFHGAFDPMDHDFELLPYHDAWRGFLKHTGFIPIASELLVNTNDYAGQLDLLGAFPERGNIGFLDLVDIKNTFSLMPSARVQTAGYEKALEHSHPELVAGRKIRRWVLHFKNGKCTLHPLPNRVDHKVFQAALTIHRFKNGEL